MALGPTIDLTVFTWQSSPDWYQSVCPQLNINALGSTAENSLAKLQRDIREAVEDCPEMLRHPQSTTIAVMTLDIESGEPA